MKASQVPQPESSQLPPSVPPFAQWNPTRGFWETHQPDLFGYLEPYSAIWPTSGTTLAGLAYPLPTSAHPTPDFGSSSSPGALFRTPLASDAARDGETLGQMRARGAPSPSRTRSSTSHRTDPGPAAVRRRTGWRFKAYTKWRQRH